MSLCLGGCNAFFISSIKQEIAKKTHLMDRLVKMFNVSGLKYLMAGNIRRVK